MRSFVSGVLGCVLGFATVLAAIVAALFAALGLGLKAYLRYDPDIGLTAEVTPRRLGAVSLAAAAVAMALSLFSFAVFLRAERSRRISSR